MFAVPFSTLSGCSQLCPWLLWRHSILLNGIVKGVKETCRCSIYGSIDKASAHRVVLIRVLKELWILNENGDLHITAYSPHRAGWFWFLSPFKSIALGRVTKNF